MSEPTCLGCIRRDAQIRGLEGVNIATVWWMKSVAAEVERGILDDSVNPFEILNNLYEMLGECLPPRAVASVEQEPKEATTSGPAKILEFRRNI